MKVIYYKTLPSTNLKAKELAQKEVKPWTSQEMLDEYRSGNLNFTFWDNRNLLV